MALETPPFETFSTPPDWIAVLLEVPPSETFSMPPDWIVVALEIPPETFSAPVLLIVVLLAIPGGSPLVDLTSNSPPSINVNLAILPLETISAPGATPPDDRCVVGRAVGKVKF